MREVIVGKRAGAVKYLFSSVKTTFHKLKTTHHIFSTPTSACSPEYSYRTQQAIVRAPSQSWMQGLWTGSCPKIHTSSINQSWLTHCQYSSSSMGSQGLYSVFCWYIYYVRAKLHRSREFKLILNSYNSIPLPSRTSQLLSPAILHCHRLDQRNHQTRHHSCPLYISSGYLALLSWLCRGKRAARNMVKWTECGMVSIAGIECGTQQCMWTFLHQIPILTRTQITHIQFLTLLYPSRTEARLIIFVLGMIYPGYIPITSNSPCRSSSSRLIRLNICRPHQLSDGIRHFWRHTQRI